jgi:hypothetical protein
VVDAEFGWVGVMSVQAEHAGTCGDCDRPIRVGQWISKTADGVWEHVKCPAPPKVCGECFTEVTATGACMCEVGS